MVTDRRAIILVGATKALGLNNGGALLLAILENMSNRIKKGGVERGAEMEEVEISERGSMELSGKGVE